MKIFSDKAGDVVSLMREFGQMLVATVQNGKVHYMGINATGNHTSWYDRLHSHLIVGGTVVDLPFDPTVNPGEIPATCISTGDLNILILYIINAIANNRNFCVEWISEGNVWTFCDGSCGHESCNN